MEVNTRSAQKPFDYKKHCIICAENADFDNRHPGRNSKVSNISSSVKQNTVHKTLLQACEGRTDDMALNVKARLLYGGDIAAKGAKYHRKCLQMFLSNLPSGDSDAQDRTSHEKIRIEAFQKVCNWLSSDPGKQTSISELSTKMASFFPSYLDSYSNRYVKKLLEQHFGASITFVNVQGKSDMIVFTEKLPEILLTSFTEIPGKLDDHYNMKQIEESSAILKSELSTLTQSTDVYPTPDDLNVEALERMVPPLLQQLISSLSSESRSTSANSKKKLQDLAVAQAIIHSNTSPSYISPLLLSIGLFIHQTTRSRISIDVLSTLGFCASYAEVMKFERAAVTSQTVNDLPLV